MNNLNSVVCPGYDKTAPAFIDPPDILELALNYEVCIAYLCFLRLDERYIASQRGQGRSAGLCWRAFRRYLSLSIDFDRKTRDLPLLVCIPLHRVRHVYTLLSAGRTLYNGRQWIHDFPFDFWKSLSVIVNNQLDAQLFLYVFISIRYMFRATVCSSSGESIASTRRLVYVTM
jgi:hypothetical protein